jgi:hypothetical protein
VHVSDWAEKSGESSSTTSATSGASGIGAMKYSTV